MDKHPDVMELIALARGELPEARKQKVAMHCRGCRVCGDQLSAVLLLRETKRSARPSRWTANVLPAAAMLLVLTGVVFVWDAWRGDSPSFQTEPGTTGSAISELATSETLPEILVYVEFGQSEPVAGSQDPLREALQAIVNKDYETAVAILPPHLDREPGDRKAATLLGIALYLSGDNSGEVEQLLRFGERSRTSWVREWAGWYLANFFLRRRALDRARSQLEKLADYEDVITGDNARKLLDELARHPESPTPSNGQPSGPAIR